MTESRVLVVDDDDDIRALVRTLLERGGIVVRDAPNGREGLREFHAWRPDLVVLDVSMPELDGWNVLERIRDMSDVRSEEHTSELQSRRELVCRLLLEKKK